MGEDGGTLTFVENKAGANKPLSMATPVSSWKNIQAGSTCKPQIVDLNRDGLMDIVTGTRVGVLRYFQNIGTKSLPNFNTTATTVKIGNVDVGEFGSGSGLAAPFFMDFKGKYTVFVGSESGKISVYDSIDNNLTGSWRLVNNDYGKIRDGQRSIPILRNINGDENLELIIGNYRGGLTAYKTNYKTDGTSPVKNIDNSLIISVFPNPASDFLNIDIKNISTTDKVKISVFNTMGQLLKVIENVTPTYSFDLKELSQGVYYMNVETGEKSSVVKFVKN